MSYEMPLYVGGTERNLLQQFLHAAFAEKALSGGIRLRHSLRRVKFRHRHKPHPLRKFGLEFLYLACYRHIPVLYSLIERSAPNTSISSVSAIDAIS